MMNKNIMLGSTLLATAFTLNTATVSAMELQSPYTSTAYADAYDNYSFASDRDGPNAGPSSASASVMSASSSAFVNGYDLHSSSAVYDYYNVPPRPTVKDSSTLIPNDRPMLESYINTRGSASFSQEFDVVGTGAASLNFSWDGFLSSNGIYDVGYSFSATVWAGDDFLGSIYDNGSIYGLNASAEVDESDSIGLLFDSNDIGTTFTVYASLDTWVGNGELETQALRMEDVVFADLASASLSKEPMELRPTAFADFSNTASFSFTGNGVIAPAAVPVPAAVWLFGSALFGLIGMRRKKSA